MSVTKTVTTDAVDQDGDPISYGPFDVEVTCTYLGEAVVADGFEDSPMAFTITDGETVDLTGLPVRRELHDHRTRVRRRRAGQHHPADRRDHGHVSIRAPRRGGRRERLHHRVTAVCSRR